MYCQVLTIPKVGETIICLGNLFQCLTVLSYVYMEFLLFRFSCTASCYPHLYPVWCLYTLTSSSQSLCFLRLNNPSFLSLSSQDRTGTAHQMCLTSPGQRGRIAFLDPPAMLFLIQTRVLLAASAARADCRPIDHLPTKTPPRLFLQSCLPAGHPPTCTGTWNYSFPGTGFQTPLW